MIHRIASIDDERVEDYRNVRDADLVGRRGLFMAEGRLVVRTLLKSSRFSARSVFVTEAVLESLRDVLGEFDGPVYVAQQGVMDGVVGFPIHRGALAAGERPEAMEPSDVVECGDSEVATLVVLEDLANHDNVGAVFRNALALGADGVLLSPRCCDPLYRKAIRVSMGATLRVPYGGVEQWPAGLEVLRERGYVLVALTTETSAVDIREFASMRPVPGRIALLLGAEGAGLSSGVMDMVDIKVRIGMERGVDSLNVATAGGIALHCLGRADWPTT